MKKENKEISTIEKSKISKEDFLILLLCILITSLLYIPSLNRPWLIYDEKIIYGDGYFAHPLFFTEIFEIIKEFGLNFNVISSNPIYSSNYVIRTCPFSQILGMTVQFFLNKNPFLFHVFNLMLHLINVTLVFFILKTFSKSILKFNSIIIGLLTLIWSCHPANVEAIFLSSNFGATFSYIFFFGLILDYIQNRKNNLTTLRKVILPILFLIPMFTNEYIVSLPLIIFIFALYFNYNKNNFLNSFKKSLYETFPYIIGLLIYVIYFFTFTFYRTTQANIENSLIVFLERIFWLSPQIFFHNIKLLFFPLTLSIDQSILVKLGGSLLDPYSIFCILFLIFWLIIPITFFLNQEKHKEYFLLNYGIFFSLLPFLHILMPSYALSADRYLYTSSAILVFGFLKIIENLNINKKQIFIPLLSFFLVFCFSQSYTRTLDWKDNYKFIFSNIKKIKDPLYKAIKTAMLGNAIEELKIEKKENAKKYFLQAINYLDIAKQETLKEISSNKKTPLIIKTYGLDPKSKLIKINSIKANLKYAGLHEDVDSCIELLDNQENSLQNLDPKAIELFVKLLIEKRDFKKARDILTTANTLHPHLPVILLSLVDYYLAFENNRSEAEKHLNEALEFYPYDTSVLYKALIYYAFFEEKNNAAKYGYLYGLRTQSEFGYEAALKNYLDLNDFTNAEKSIKKLLKINDKNPKSLILIGEYYYRKKDLSKALEYVKKAYLLSKPNKDKTLIFNSGRALTKLYFETGSITEATTTAKELLKYASDEDSYIALGKLYKKLELKKELEYCLKKLERKNAK